MGMMKDFYHDEICASSEEAVAEREHEEGMAALYDNYPKPGDKKNDNASDTKIRTAEAVNA